MLEGWAETCLPGGRQLISKHQMTTYNPFSLKGKTVFVTGASSGIGRGIAIACSRMGAALQLNGRNEERLAATLAALEGTGHNIVTGDLLVKDDVERIVTQLPALDGVVHCAGIGERKICKQIEQTDIDNLMGANFEAPVKLQTLLLQKKKIKKSSSIVFIASVAPFAPTIGNALYSASKGALIAYANCLSIELAPRQVRVNCICPGMIWTDLIYRGGLTEEELREDEQKYPLKRYGTPDDVANAVIYLLSDASSWMTGTCLKIAGGIIN